jgi:chorismate--pyruvate lyase
VKVFAQASSPRARWLKKPMSSGIYRHWLIDGGSLTRRLQLRCRSFAVHPLKVHDAKPQIDEAALLGLTPRQKALLREVHLRCAGKPVVFAHSILPHKSLRGAWQGLGRLGTRPLGGALFSDPRVVRTPLEFKKLSKHHALYRRAVASLDMLPPALWARRSVFSLNCAAILVTEVFLPQVLAI